MLRLPYPRCSGRASLPCSRAAALFSRVAGSPALHRAPLNELRPVHHEAVFGAPGLPRTREGGFRYRISLPYRKSLFFTPNAPENASRTPGACFLHGAHIPYRRRPSPVPNANPQHPHPATTALPANAKHTGKQHTPTQNERSPD